MLPAGDPPATGHIADVQGDGPVVLASSRPGARPARWRLVWGLWAWAIVGPAAAQESERPLQENPPPAAERKIPEALLFANTLLRDRRYDLAAEEYEKFLKTAEGADADDAHFGLANARLFLGEYKEARRQFEAFLKSAPEHANAPTAWFRVGETAYMLGDLPAARGALETYTAGNANHRFLDMAWTYLGDVCFALKDLAKAKQAYEKSVSAFPEGRLVERAKY